MQRQYYYFTRGHLASELIMQGFSVTPSVNVYHPERNAWKTDMTPQLCRAVEQFYRAQGLPIPQPIKEAQAYFRQQDAAAYRATQGAHDGRK